MDETADGLFTARLWHETGVLSEELSPATGIETRSGASPAHLRNENQLARTSSTVHVDPK